MNRRGIATSAALVAGGASILAWIGLYNYPVFHVATELVGIAICASVFSIGWNARHITNQDHFAIMASGFLGCAILEFLHMLAHGHFPAVFFANPNATVHFLLAARTIIAVAFLHALYVRERKIQVDQEVVLAAYVFAALGAAFWITRSSRSVGPFVPDLQWLPQLVWRWAVNGGILLGLSHLLRRPISISLRNRVFLMVIMVSEVAGQFAFAVQTDLGGTVSVLGHLFKILTRLCVYRVLVISTLKDPYRTLFQDLTEAVQLMRAQLHDMINDLTLASTYLQMNRIAEAQQCIEVIAADLSDRYNYTTLPNDAWYQIIAAKSDLAQEQGIEFLCKLNAPPPDDFHQRRLLPKLVGNLLDNAMDAVAGAPEPRIILEWNRSQEGTVLKVTNSGSEIPPELRPRIFEPGLSTKGKDRGFGLTICQKIANELGASLTVDSNAEATTFTLILPQAGQEHAAGDEARG